MTAFNLAQLSDAIAADIAGGGPTDSSFAVARLIDSTPGAALDLIEHILRDGGGNKRLKGKGRKAARREPDDGLMAAQAYLLALCPGGAALRRGAQQGGCPGAGGRAAHKAAEGRPGRGGRCRIAALHHAPVRGRQTRHGRRTSRPDARPDGSRGQRHGRAHADGRPRRRFRAARQGSRTGPRSPFTPCWPKPR